MIFVMNESSSILDKMMVFVYKLKKKFRKIEKK